METIEYKNHTIKIMQDEYPINPRIDFDNAGTMVCFHKKYNLGDKHKYDIEDIADLEANNICLPIYMYDHSGITIKTSPFSCRFDSGQLGIIFISYANALKEFKADSINPELIAKAKQLLQYEVEEYDKYLQGDVWHYSITNSNDIEIDGCGGFYGADYCLAEARHAVDYFAK